MNDDLILIRLTVGFKGYALEYDEFFDLLSGISDGTYGKNELLPFLGNNVKQSKKWMCMMKDIIVHETSVQCLDYIFHLSFNKGVFPHLSEGKSETWTNGRRIAVKCRSDANNFIVAKLKKDHFEIYSSYMKDYYENNNVFNSYDNKVIMVNDVEVENDRWQEDL